VAQWLERWICSNPPPCHGMDVSLVAPNTTTPYFVNSQMVNWSLFISVSPISTVVFNTFMLK